MKHLLFMIGFFAFTKSYAQLNEQTIKSEIKKVKLYLTSGEMTHETSIKLAKGRNRISFSGISAFADQRSIQFSVEEHIRLVSISTEMDFLAAEGFNPKITVLKDSLSQLKDRLQNNKDLFASYQAELGVLNTNKDLKGEETLTIDKIKAAADYYRTRTFEINKTITKLNKEQEYLYARIEETRQQLTEFNFIENQRSNQVIVILDTDAPITVNATLKYIVSDCGWAPIYDLSAQDIHLPINLRYKAQVYNNTGNEWKNVQLTIATSDPTLSAASPVLNPFYLTFSTQVESKRVKYVQPNKAPQQSRSEVVSEINLANQRAYDNYYMEEEQKSMNNKNAENKLQLKQVSTVSMKTIELSDLNAEFIIATPFSCPTDARPYMVEIKNLNIPATFSHISVPKLDQGAFLIAKIIGWQDLDLIPGPTNVYFGGNYVGVSEINTQNVADTLELSFGRDPKVQVLRKIRADLSIKRTSGSSRKDSYFYDIVIRNNRSVPISIEVFDQIPLSNSSEISVTTETIGTGQKNEENGEVRYTSTIKAGETANFDIGFTVKYPKNGKIDVRRFRVLSCPSF
jgi:uncharacterized protein (TIGR02231 family)